MGTVRKRYSAAFKAQVALEACKGQKTLSQLASEFGVHPVQITQWKKHALAGLPYPLRGGRQPEAQSRRGVAGAALPRDRPAQSGAGLAAKKRADSLGATRTLIDPDYEPISVARQCELLRVPRSTWYYHPKGESPENLELMRLLDEQYTRTPFYGIRRMTAWLRQQGYEVNHKRVGRLLRLMGVEAIYPKPHLSRPGATAAALSLSVAGSADPAGESRLEFRYYVRADAARLSLSGGDPGLVQSLRAQLGTVQYAGWGVLPLRSGSRPWLGRSPRSSTPIKAHSSPAWPLPGGQRQRAFASVGMGAGELWTMSLSSGSGGR